VALAALGGVLFTWYGSHQQETARSLAAQSMAKLGYRQTNAEANDDPKVLGEASRLARAAAAASPVPEALGAHALLRTLELKWHYGAKTWDAAEFSELAQLTERALAQPTAEAHLGRAILMSRACRVAPHSNPRRPSFCSEAYGRFEHARAALGSDGRGWLAVDLAWMYVGFLNVGASEAADAGRLDEVMRLSSVGLAVCSEAAPLAAHAPVNDLFLGRNCLTAAGRAGDLATYYRWAQELRARDVRTRGSLHSRTVRRVYKSAGPGCVDLKFDAKTGYPLKGEDIYWCRAVGLFALGCPAKAGAEVRRGARHDNLGRDWSALESNRLPGVACYLTANGN